MITKREFFLKAMAHEEYRRRAWVISAFALTREAPDAWQANPYPYRVVATPLGYSYVDPEKENTLSQISGGEPGKPLFAVMERIDLKAGDVPNLSTDVNVPYGNVLFNYMVLVYAFGKKIPFMTGRVNPKQIEALIVDRLRDTPKAGEKHAVDVGALASSSPANGELRDDKYLYVDEYLRFADAAFYMAGFTQLCVPAATRKTMTAADGIVELRNKLLEKNKERLHDPAVIAMIDSELVKHDREWMRGDRGEGFLITKKAFEVIRKKLFSMHGAEVGLAEGNDVTLIERSLSEGWDIDKFPAMNDSLRAGSFNRGSQTMLGGELVKWLMRASSNIAITADDCGSELGNIWKVDNTNYKKLDGFSLVGHKGPIKVTKETMADLIGKTVLVRSPMYCKLPKTDFCVTCCGDRLANNPKSISAAISGVGSVFLAIYMAASHGKALQIAEYDYRVAIT